MKTPETPHTHIPVIPSGGLRADKCKYCPIFPRGASLMFPFPLPSLLLISPLLFHSCEVSFGRFSINVALLLEDFDESFADGGGHLPRRSIQLTVSSQPARKGPRPPLTRICKRLQHRPVADDGPALPAVEQGLGRISSVSGLEMLP